MVMITLEPLKQALWIARDLSIAANGEVPQVVTDAPAILASIEAELEKQDRAEDALRISVRMYETARAERDEAVALLKDKGMKVGTAETARLGQENARLRTERDEAVAALRATPHVGGEPGQTHQSHPNVLACHACAVLDRLSTPKEPETPEPDPQRVDPEWQEKVRRARSKEPTDA